ncbi:MAG: ATP-binding protein [Phycisphaeraceae bacterium JB051]
MNSPVSQNPHLWRLVRRWRQSLSFRLTFAHLLVFVILIFASVTMIYTMQRSLLVRQGQDYAEQVGLRVVSDLNGVILQAQNQTRVLADLAQVVEPEPAKYQKLFSQIIVPPDMSDVVAGGGIWPEPYAFDPSVQRRSFFWGMEPDGSLKYYDDYNDPAGPGYHMEHWYIPGRYYPPSAAIWSRSYTDPYSLEPMVTCTVPIYKEQQFNGVATIDLKLDGLNRTLLRAANSIGGYLFVVDREGRFVAFPKMDMIRREQKDEAGNAQTRYLNLKDVTTRLPGMSRIAELHDEMNIRMIQNAQQNMPGFTERVDQLQRKYPTLTTQQTQMLIASMFDQTQVKALNPHQVRRMTLTSMPLIAEQCMVSVFHMPRTYWNVVMVVPVSTFTKPADQASNRLAIWFVGIQAFVMLILLLFARRLVLKSPRQRVIRDVLLKWDRKSDKQLADDLDEMSSSMKQIRHLVRTQTPSANGQTHAIYVNTDIQRLVHDVLAIDAEEMNLKNIQTHVQVSVEQLIKVDAYRLAQVLTNLMTNARHALEKVGDDQRRLHISAHLIDNSILQITVHDTGCGIDEKQLPNIFEHGYTTNPSARGVGLHSAALAVRELNGSINAHSDGSNKGSTFTISIPVEVQPTINLISMDS